MPQDPSDNELFGVDLDIESEQDVETPRMYRVLMHNDHYTTMDFVVEMLVKVFHKAAAEATQIMMEIHNKGMGICGIFTYDIAVTKINQVHQKAKLQGYPLKCSYEEI